MVKTYEKVKICGCRMTQDLYNKFLFKVKEDGFTIQQALIALVLEYVKGNFDIKGNS